MHQSVLHAYARALRAEQLALSPAPWTPAPSRPAVFRFQTHAPSLARKHRQTVLSACTRYEATSLQFYWTPAHALCRFPSLHLLESTFQMRGMHTIIRDCETTKGDFIFMADRLIRLVRSLSFSPPPRMDHSPCYRLRCDVGVAAECCAER